MLKTRYRAICVFSLMLMSGCATNFAPISTFAEATNSMSSQASDTIGRIALTCHDTVGLVDQQLSMLSDVREHNRRLLEKAPGAQAATAVDLQRLKRIQDGIDGLIAASSDARSQMASSCVLDEVGQKEAIALVEVVKAYASALNSLAKNEFTTYPSAADSLADSIGQFKAGGAQVVSDDKIAAIKSLNQFIYSIATASYRQHQLSLALSQENRNKVGLLVDAIDRVASAYSILLDTEIQQIDDLLNTAKTFQQGDLLYEPIGNVEFSLRLLALKGSIEARLKSLDDYRQLVKRLSPELESAASLVENPSSKDKADELLAYARQANAVRTTLNKAF